MAKPTHPLDLLRYYVTGAIKRREGKPVTEKTAITPEEQAERVKSGHGWLLCDHCDNPATVHDTATDKYLCDEHSNTKAS